MGMLFMVCAPGRVWYNAWHDAFMMSLLPREYMLIVAPRAGMSDA